MNNEKRLDDAMQAVSNIAIGLMALVSLLKKLKIISQKDYDREFQQVFKIFEQKYREGQVVLKKNRN